LGISGQPLEIPAFSTGFLLFTQYKISRILGQPSVVFIQHLGSVRYHRLIVREKSIVGQPQKTLLGAGFSSIKKYRTDYTDTGYPGCIFTTVVNTDPAGICQYHCPGNSGL